MTDWRIVKTRKTEQRRFKRSQEGRDGWLHYEKSYGSQKQPLSTINNTITVQNSWSQPSDSNTVCFSYPLGQVSIETGVLWLPINHPKGIDQTAIDLHILLLKLRIPFGSLLVSFFFRVAFQTRLVYCCKLASRSAISSVYCVTQGYLWTWSLSATASIQAIINLPQWARPQARSAETCYNNRMGLHSYT